MVGYKIVNNVLKSMDTVRKHLLKRLTAKGHNFFTLCRLYNLNYDDLGRPCDDIFAHLGTQGWNEQKWQDNVENIHAAVFWWVCRELTVSVTISSKPMLLVGCLR